MNSRYPHGSNTSLTPTSTAGVTGTQPWLGFSVVLWIQTQVLRLAEQTLLHMKPFPWPQNVSIPEAFPECCRLQLPSLAYCSLHILDKLKAQDSHSIRQQVPMASSLFFICPLDFQLKQGTQEVLARNRGLQLVRRGNIYTWAESKVMFWKDNKTQPKGWCYSCPHLYPSTS